MQQYHENKTLKKRVILITAGLLVLLLAYRFFDLQILKYDRYWNKAWSNSIRKIPINAPRGIIYDRNGRPIVDNNPIYDLKVIPVDVTEEFNFDLLGRHIGMTPDSLQNLVDKYRRGLSRFHPQLIKRHVDFEVFGRLQEYILELPGLIFSELPARVYPDSAHLVHALGYLRTVTEKVIEESDPDLGYSLSDVYGAAGLEQVYETRLRGKDGVAFHKVDILGRVLDKYSGADDIKPVSGERINLAIDVRLQRQAEQLLDGRPGAVVAMDPANGEILVFASSPDYDLRSFTGPIPVDLWNDWNSNPDRPLMNRVVNGTYPPGSTYKLIAAALALETGAVSTDWTVDCKGAYRFGNRVFHCWNLAGHGTVNLKSAIRHSCNIYFYKLIQQLDFEQWSEMSRKFGFGAKTGIDLPYESAGVVPDREYMNRKYTSRGWAKGSLLNFVIGQGDVLATPLQVVQMINLIATEGHSFKPHLKLDEHAEALDLELKPGTWWLLKKAMWEVVNEKDGTGRNARISGIGVIRGKTGTAENPHGEPHSWFAGYITMPSGEMMSVATVIENGGKGSGIAARISRDLFQLFSELHSGVADAE